MTALNAEPKPGLSRERHRRHANPFTIRGPIRVPDWAAIFARPAPFALDIGCGPGRFVVEIARANPAWNVVGLEIRQHLVAETLYAAQQAQLTNAHALLANANSHLETLFPDQSVAFVSVNFPDPWYKKRHHKRRVVQLPWLDMLSKKMMPGAQLHTMTDYEPIAQHMLQAIEAHGGFVNLDGPGTFATQSTTGWPSERESIHQRRGEQIYRLRFRYGLANSEGIR